MQPPGVPFDVPTVDAEAGARTRGSLARYSGPAGAFGRLEDLAVWLSEVQGTDPPRALRRRTAVVVAGDHGIAARSVSAAGAPTTSAAARAVLAEAGPTAALAATARAHVRLLDVSVRWPAGTAPAPSHVADGSGAIDVADALDDTTFAAAFAAGQAFVDAEVDGGTDVLLVGSVGRGATTAAAAVVAALAAVEPVVTVGRGSGIDDTTWMRKATAVRDALRRVWPHRHDAREVLRIAGGPDLVALTGVLVQAAVRRTPVVLDGVVAAACALAAEALAPGARRFWLAAQSGPEPAETLALSRLDLPALVDLGIRADAAAAALATLPVLDAAVALCPGADEAAAADDTAGADETGGAGSTDEPGPDPAL
jgi:nicotinate-nucleotide--dimethylbenzimidazole phosphoribosyltransferase